MHHFLPDCLSDNSGLHFQLSKVVFHCNVIRLRGAASIIGLVSFNSGVIKIVFVEKTNSTTKLCKHDCYED